MATEAVLRSKFRGALLGTLLGDCMGAPFEGQPYALKSTLQKYFDRQEDPTFDAPFKKYTDDTAMMKSEAKFLIDNPEPPDYKHLAKLFVKEFYDSPRRGYGANVVSVFEKLKKTKYDDVFKPASEQFDGNGSYGNGGAMRIAPIALFFHDDFENMIKVATDATKVTHSNILGVNGAILQCLAIQQALSLDPNKPVDTKQFLSELQAKMKTIEDQYSEEHEDDTPHKDYQGKLALVEKYLEKEETNDHDELVVDHLGHGISAYESVPTAIYCFLRAQKSIEGIDTDNIFRRTIQYAISLGGDTDTIACMAGAIAGAYLGEESINPNILSHCEKPEQITKLADELFEASTKRT